MKTLRDGNGDYLYDDDKLSKMVVDFYKSLYTSDLSSALSLPISGYFPYLDDNIFKFIHKLLSKIEIKD